MCSAHREELYNRWAGWSPGLVSPQESLIDVRFQEAWVAVPGHQAVDELLRRVKGCQTRLAHILRDVLSGPTIYIDLKLHTGAFKQPLIFITTATVVAISKRSCLFYLFGCFCLDKF